eukprot:2049776-Alexandrium_andersonii.AAC.1
MADDLEPGEDELPGYEDIQGEDSAPTAEDAELAGTYSPTEPASLPPGKEERDADNYLEREALEQACTLYGLTGGRLA